MKKYNFLVLTDHTTHSSENSLYALVSKLKSHPQCGNVYVASRGNEENDLFFKKGNSSNIHGYRLKESLSFEEARDGLLFETRILSSEDFDVIFMRLPRPVSTSFLENLASTFSEKIFINHPLGIEKTGTKKFLLNFPEVCPSMKLCHSINELLEFSKQFPIVVKPLKEYGGKGIFRLEGDKVYEGSETYPTEEYLKKKKKEIEQEGVLAMKFLKNVSQGDKRILVVNGKILAASLRLPKEESWLCNVAQGGSSVKAELTNEEIRIIENITPILLNEGIVMFGADTLVNDDGKRILSEINTLSIGGFPQSEQQTGKPVVQQAIDGIFDYINKQNMKIQATYIEEFKLSDTPKGEIRHYWLRIVSNGLGEPVNIPVIVARGKKDFPVLGLTAAVHGNELNGVPVIQRLFNELEVGELEGTIIGIPVVNIPSYQRKRRRFPDGTDLNHIMPGKENGNVSQVYAFRFIEKIVKKFDYLLDLHTASTGRINSYYIRADMKHPVVRRMALLQNAQIIVHNPPSDGTLRGTADELDIPAITLEVGNPNTFQKKMIRSGVEGIHNVLSYLEMTEDEIEPADKETVICKNSYWLYTKKGGLLNLHVDLMDMLKKGEKIATIKDIFGNILEEYFAPEDGIVIGKSVSPVNQSGGRILHLGIVRE